MTDTKSIDLPDPPQRTKSKMKIFEISGTKFEIDERYELIQTIGWGAYGVVCSATDKITGQKVAIKKVADAFANTIDAKRLLREIKILRRFKHENLISILDIMEPVSKVKFNDLYIVYDLMGTDLHRIIVSPQPLSDDHVCYFLYQLLRGLKYVHSAGVIHRDIKPSNLLLDANCDLKICDFGLARLYNPKQIEPEQDMTEYVATRWYRAPEIMLCWNEYSAKVDMWSVGCIMAELLGRKPLFPGRDSVHQVELIVDVLGKPSTDDMKHITSERALTFLEELDDNEGKSFKAMYPKAPENALDLLKKTLEFCPSKRITIEEALKHPYFSQYHDPEDEPNSSFIFPGASFLFEQEENLKSSRIRDLMYDEIVDYCLGKEKNQK